MTLELTVDKQQIFRMDIVSRPQNEAELIVLLKEILAVLESKKLEDNDLF